MKEWSDVALQTKLALIIAGIGLLLSLGSYALLRGFIYPAFETFELENSRAGLSRVTRAFDGQMLSLNVLSSAYSYWTVTHSAMQEDSLSPEYIEDNVDIGYLPTVDAHLMLFYSANGKLQWGGLLDPRDDSEVPLEGEWFEQLTPEHPLVRHDSVDSEVKGLLATPFGVMLVASSAILTDERSGPINGSVVVGRVLTPKLMADISVATSVAANLVLLSDTSGSQRLTTLVTELSAAADETITETHEDTILERMLMRDIHGQSVAILEARAPRWISGIGWKAISTTMTLLMLAIILFSVIASVLIRRQIVKPIEELKNHMNQARLSSDQSFRFANPRKDEIGALAFEFDSLMSRLGETHAQLEHTLEKAEALSKIKSEFLATMSHEMRTPLNGVIGMTELLLTTELSEKQKYYANSVMSSGNILLNVISDILDFSKISAGKMQLESKPIVIAEVLADTNDIMAEAARQKGIEYQCVCQPQANLEVLGDAFRIRQVVLNLTGNAIKFTEKGKVQLKVACEPEDSNAAAGTVSMRFSVTDTGIGISDEQKDIIFDSFSQSDSSMTRRFGGTGLGLSICKELVTLMGGTLEVKSEYGKGSEFYFTLAFPLADSTHLPD